MLMRVVLAQQARALHWTPCTFWKDGASLAALCLKRTARYFGLNGVGTRDVSRLRFPTTWTVGKRLVQQRIGVFAPNPRRCACQIMSENNPMQDKFDIYDILGVLVPGVLVVCALDLAFPNVCRQSPQ